MPALSGELELKYSPGWGGNVAAPRLAMLQPLVMGRPSGGFVPLDVILRRVKVREKILPPGCRFRCCS